jgi:hypothetical protein
MGLRRVTALLDGVGERGGLEWFGVAGGWLEVSLDSYGSAEELILALENEGTFSASEVESLRQAKNQLAGLWVEVRVS